MKVTWVCAGQYSRGRKLSVESPSQDQAPTTGLDVVSWSDRSTAALLVTGWLNVSMIGMPTP